jgi:undecaprenyl-diphosphatase
LDPILLIKAAVMGVVEGLTEFLPVSSTGHLILAGALLDFNDERGKLFEIVIQSAAILAVVWEYRARIGRVLATAGSDQASRRLLVNVGIAFLPLAIIGLVAGKWLKAHLFNAPTVATTSRSGATIIGGMLFGLSRQAATEFTFYLAIPTLGVASLYSLYKERALLSADDLGMWAVGMVTSFVAAFLCVRWLLRYISTHSFVPFAWYRIAFGLVVLATWWTGSVIWAD